MIKKEWLWMEYQKGTGLPHSCGAQGCLIAPTNFLSPAECVGWANKVKQLKPYWSNRGHFYTLGAATYQDDPLSYPQIAEALNPLLHEHFEPLLRKVYNHYTTPYTQLKGVARAGFHIFDKTSNGLVGNAHIDEPFKRVKWPSEHFTNPFSFTMLLEQPAAGAGMDYWSDSTDEDLHRATTEGIYPPHEHLQYELGVLYTHDGLTPHRIANKGDMLNNEYRITLQGHGLTLAHGRRVIYF
tara:strand:- start:315 stop:1034 length:720 start_codon:yes stop_codon:yes gene_type:complete